MTSRKRSTLVLLALASALATIAHAEDRKDCQLKKYGEVTFTTTEGGIPLVPVVLNDKPAHMILNTGAAFSFFFHRVIEQYSLPTHTAPNGIQLMGKPVLRVADFRSLAVARVLLGKGTLLVTSEEVKLPDDDVVGFMALDQLSHVDFELDLARNRLALFSQEHCPNLGAYWSKEYAAMPMLQSAAGDWYVPMELDGKKVAASLSTFAVETSITTEATRKLYGFDENSAGVETEADANSNGARYHFRAMQMTAPGLTIKNSHVRLRKGPNCPLFTGGSKNMATYGDTCAGVYPMTVGRSVLKELRLYFSTKEKMLYFTSADAGKQTPSE